MADEQRVRQIVASDQVLSSPWQGAEVRWRAVFPGEGRQLGVVRQWLKSFLAACPARDDVVSVAVELCSNAVLHTGSGAGGRFCVEVWGLPGLVRVAVADGGGLTEPRLVDDPGGEHGRGLRLVAGLSTRRGVRGGPRGRVVWADIPWDGVPPAMPVPEADAGTCAAVDELARMFPRVPVWFGVSTAQWWALADCELIAASSPQELARLITRAVCLLDDQVPVDVSLERPWPAGLADPRLPRHARPGSQLGYGASQ
jgi:anti-sigma regulatory factor (Ser/Thr protein kinase)